MAEDGAGVRSVVKVVDGKRMRDDEVAVGAEPDGGDARRRKSDEGSETDWTQYDRRARWTRGPRGRRGGSGGRMCGRWRSDGAMDVEGERYEDVQGEDEEQRSSGRTRMPYSKLVIQGVPAKYPSRAIGEEIWREKGKAYGLGKDELLEVFRLEVLRSAGGAGVVVVLPTFLQRSLVDDGWWLEWSGGAGSTWRSCNAGAAVHTAMVIRNVLGPRFAEIAEVDTK